MAPYYEALCKDLKWQLDSELLNKMKKANEEELKRLDDVLEDAEKNLGESEIRDAMMAKAEYLIRIGDKVRSQHDNICAIKCATCGFDEHRRNDQHKQSKTISHLPAENCSTVQFSRVLPIQNQNIFTVTTNTPRVTQLNAKAITQIRRSHSSTTPALYIAGCRYRTFR